MSTALAKAGLQPVGDNGTRLEFTYNPEFVQIAKQNQWKQTPAKDAAVPKTEFTGSGPRTLTMTLLFDDMASPNAKLTVPQAVERLLGWMAPGGGKAKKATPPPHLLLVWGANTSVHYECVLTNLTAKYTLFEQDGTPVRATFQVTLQEVPAPTAKQNPTSGGPVGRSTRILRSGDSLQSIANEEYGTPTAWRALAVANGIDDPLRLRPGQTILVPPAAT